MTSGVVISVKIPVAWERMGEREKQKLRQICGRAGRVIRAALGVIREHEAELITGRKRIDGGQLQRLTLTATRGGLERYQVPHDFKARFPRMSTTELQECLRVAAGIYESYLALRTRQEHASRPKVRGTTPRWMTLPSRAQLLVLNGRWYLSIFDSLDSRRQGRRTHERLYIPLRVVAFHKRQLRRGRAKAAQVFRDTNGRWWVTVAVRVVPPRRRLREGREPAVLGVDLGVRKAVCATLLTTQGISETRYFTQPDKERILQRYEHLTASLRRERDLRRAVGRDYSGVVRRLRHLRDKRANVSREQDRLLVRELTNYILRLERRYNLYVAVGRLTGIRNAASRNNGNGPWYRRMIHRWAFARITRYLAHALAQYGWQVTGKGARLVVVSERWTSITCSRCGRGGHRPRQNLFVCPMCGLHTNADRNASINIAARLIMLTSSLREVRGLGRWARKAAHQPKARRESHSRGKSLSSRHRRASYGGRPAATPVQTMLLDDDLAVVRNAESLSVSKNDALGVTQKDGCQAARKSGKAPANSRHCQEGGDACRGRAERIGSARASSQYFPVTRPGRRRRSDRLT
ncbi:MAG: zinc ribbon domain-containing protein [Candidatus Thorarchaeota archaeon]